MSNFIKKVKHPETGECVEAEFLDDYFGKHNYGLRLPDGRVFREGCLAICKTEEGKYEGTELLTDHIHQKGKMVEPQGKSVVEDWEKEWEKFVKDEFMLSGSTPDPKGSQRVWSNAWNLQQRTKVFIRNLQKKTDDKWKKKIGECLGEIEKMKVKTTEYESEAKMSLQVPTGKILPNGEVEMVTTIEQGKIYKHQTILTEEEIIFNQALDECIKIINGSL